MKAFWKRGDALGLEEELRASRPTPPGELRERIARQVAREAVPFRIGGLRIALAVASTALLVAAVAAAGAAGPAVSGLGDVVQTAKNAVTPGNGPSAARRNGAGVAANQYKTTICHRTGSATNPFVEITVSNNALPAHAAHGDIIPAPPGGCPTS